MSTLPSTAELPKQYDHAAAQRRWYPFWEKQGYFHSNPDERRTPFTIAIPPPNVTGALHLGHALTYTLQDILIRFKRMQGFNALWMPGTDHAGIATQAVVERRLLTLEKKTRHELGREALVRRIWQWKDEYEARILDQLKQLGASCDWRRTRFTLDDMCARAVRHTFFRMFKDGLIYRGKRLVNWDTLLQTAVSDDEVFHETVAGHFWHLKYPVIDPRPGEPQYVTIATTRPETMLGDTAVAVHPDAAGALARHREELSAKFAAASPKQRAEIQAELDAAHQRQRDMLLRLLQLKRMADDGRRLRLPLLNREIPLIADEWAKPEMGSGCVKITPGHDPNDYEVGQRHRLPMLNILNPDGTLNEQAGPYQGATIEEARARVVADLDAEGLVERVEDREIELAHSDRSQTPIEPMLADQWFVKMDTLAQSAMDAVIDGRVKIVPPRYAKGYLDWLGEKRDWPVSRQLWWGHRIPIWYAKGPSEPDLRRAFAGRDDVAWRRDAEHDRWLICARDEDLPLNAIPGCKIDQDEDVLDTWFSSALWPHSTLGWPDRTPELKYYYPTSVLVTNRDILTLWVARMVLTGLYNVGDVPFREVFIHPKILDGYGEGMSKSKGNGVDPLDVIEKVGADSLRFGMAYLTTQTQDVRMPVDFECAHCQSLIPQTRENRVLPRIECSKCRKSFSTQWATDTADVALPKGAVVSERFEVARNFCNKLWNAARFVLGNLDGFTAGDVTTADLAIEDRWILSRLSTVTERTTLALEAYQIADASRQLYDFGWDEFCSFYLEMVKQRLGDPAARTTAQRVLVHALDTLMRLLHPIVPFLTEEIWQLLAQAAPRRGLNPPAQAARAVMVAPWPVADPRRHDTRIEEQFARFQEVLKAIRDIRSRQNIPPRARIEFRLRADDATVALLEPMAAYFQSMAGATATAWGPSVEPPQTAAAASLSRIDLFVDLAGLIDVATERARNEREQAKLSNLITSKEKKLADERFLARAPAAVVQQERDALTELRERLAAVNSTLKGLQGGD